MNIFAAFTVLFIGLKLTHYIDWSWWLIFSPILASFAIAVSSIAFTVLYLNGR